MEQNYGYNYNNQYTEKPKAKKGKLGTVIALVAAVALIGGGAGFGGAYLASHSIGVIGGADGPTAIIVGDENDNTDNDQKPADGKEDKNDGNNEGDIAGALSAINSTEAIVSDKIHPHLCCPVQARRSWDRRSIWQVWVLPLPS